MIHLLFKIFTWLGSEWILVVLFALSVLTGAVVLARWFELRKLKKASERFWSEHGEAWLREADSSSWRNKLTEIRTSYPCLETETLQVIEKAEKRTDSNPEKAVSAYLESRQLKLERYIGILGTIGSNAPFIGLLGTVLGIIRAFHDMQTNGLSQGMENISGGIAEALVATAIGLLVAIPAVVFFNILNKRIGNLIRRAESIGSLVFSNGEPKNKE